MQHVKFDRLQKVHLAYMYNIIGFNQQNRDMNIASGCALRNLAGTIWDST